MNHNDLDALARALGKTGESRRSLFAGLAGLASVAVLPNLDAAAKHDKKAKKRKRRRRRRQDVQPQVCPAQNQCGPDCCSPEGCFETFRDPDTVKPTTYGCCPAQSLCRSSAPGFKDQCCYPDEFCKPELGLNPLVFQTICCRPCPSGGVDGCCPEQSQECVNGVCTTINTARLARVRR
jgi:hypothetical protein